MKHYAMRRGALDMTPFASLVLCLMLMAVTLCYPVPRGMLVEIASGECVDTRRRVLDLRADGTLRLNDIAIVRSGIQEGLRRSYRPGETERLVFLKADPAASFQDVVDLLDAAGHLDRVALTSPSVNIPDGCLAVMPPPLRLEPPVKLSPVRLWPW